MKDPLATAASARITLRFVRRVPSMLRRPLSPDASERLRIARFATREAEFVEQVRRGVYDHPASPYAQLLRHASCEPGDLERLVGQLGLDAALARLAAAGVYLTVDELKGRRVVERGSTSFECGPDAIRNPQCSFHLAVRSGGTRSSGTPVLMDLAFVQACGVAAAAFLGAWGDDGWRRAIWETPGAGARFRLLEYGSVGALPERWFSQVDPAAPQLDPVFRWSERATRLGGRLSGVSMPRPTHVSLEDPRPIVRWMADILHGGGQPFLFTFPSSAVRLCRAATDDGVDLTGARLLLTGEPITAARLATIEATGASALPKYGSIEVGPVGYGCLAPNAPDDVHVLHDLHALVHAPTAVREAEGLPERALLITALHPKSPFVLINASMGDEGALATRSCGCAVEALGYPGHVTAIRSFEKLTSEGMTFLDTDVVRVLESVLPSELGGAPTDYQLVEREIADGRVQLVLLVHPRLGELDEDRVKDVFLRALGAGGIASAMMELLWRDAGLLQVERAAPRSTRAGKIQHLHRELSDLASSHSVRRLDGGSSQIIG